jgi:hypothetical protein
MEVYVSINGVLRNLIQKFDYHYCNHFLETDPDAPQQEGTPFEYRVTFPIRNDNLLESFAFESKDELDYFLFVEFALEIFGYSGVSYPTAISDLNKLIHDYKDINFTLIGIDELGKSRPATLFFLSKNTFFGNNIRFISSKDIKDEWNKCDMWITDNRNIIENCPTNKTAVKFNTDYNQHFTNKIEINNLTNFDLCLKSSEKSTISMLTRSLKNVVRHIQPKKKRKLL